MGVVVPAYDEEALIAATLGGVSPLVDRIFVVDDGSSDRTSERALELGDPRVEVLTHERRSGVGAATLTGYRRALADGIDVVVVMNGDNQMDPADLPTLVEPVARGELDYAKANRLATRPGLAADPEDALLRQRDPLDADEDRLGLLARRRLAVRLHRRLARDARAARPRPHLHELRLPERHARSPERLERAGARLPVSSDLRRGRALGTCAIGTSCRGSPGSC